MVWGFQLHAVVSLGGLFQRRGPTLGDETCVGTGVYCPSRRDTPLQTP